MAWYKPGRDGPSRRSPPKWAPMGRASRLVLAVTVIVGIAIALTIVATRTAGAADRTDGYAATPEPSRPSYPDDAGIGFEPVGDSAWRVIEPDLDCKRTPFIGARETAIAPDGRVWFLDPAMGIRELGACPLPVQAYPPSNFGSRDQALAPDGTLWVLDMDRLMSWSGSDWIVHSEGVFNVVECTGGKTWAEVEETGGACSGVCEEHGCYFRLDVAPDGTVWLSGDRLASYDGVELQEYQEDWMNGPIAGIGPDGTPWVYGRDGLYVFYP